MNKEFHQEHLGQWQTLLKAGDACEIQFGFVWRPGKVIEIQWADSGPVFTVEFLNHKKKWITHTGKLNVRASQTP